MHGVFITRRFDKQVYMLLQRLRVVHGDLSQWQILQASVIAFGSRPRDERDAFLAEVFKAPSDQPEAYPIRD